MVLIVDDKSKDKDIDDATTNIDLKRLYLMQNWTWLSSAKRSELKQQIVMMENNREHLVNSRFGKTMANRKSLYDEIPQTEEEKKKLLELIDSV